VLHPQQVETAELDVSKRSGDARQQFLIAGVSAGHRDADLLDSIRIGQIVLQKSVEVRPRA
jgi:hypothetical protein